VLSSPHQTFMKGFELCDSCFDVLCIIKGFTCFSFCSRIRTHHYSNLVLLLTDFPTFEKVTIKFLFVFYFGGFQ
jgi:hypothetical protein